MRDDRGMQTGWQDVSVGKPVVFDGACGEAFERGVVERVDDRGQVLSSGP